MLLDVVMRIWLTGLRMSVLICKKEPPCDNSTRLFAHKSSHLPVSFRYWRTGNFHGLTEEQRLYAIVRRQRSHTEPECVIALRGMLRVCVESFKLI